jgi:hypothetical protein
MTTRELRVPQVLALIGERPGITKVELSDRLDFDMDVVDIFLMDLCKLRTIESHMTTGANKLAVVGYTLTGVPLPSIFEKAVAVVAETTGKARTHVEKAVAYITANGGSATSSELHGVLGLKANDYVSSYLAVGVRQGKINKDGSNWALGKDAAPVVKTGVFNETINIAKANAAKVADRPIDLVAAHVAAPTVRIATHAVGYHVEPLSSDMFSPPAMLDLPAASHDEHVELPPEPPGKLSFALWSSGEFHMAHDGETIMIMSSDEMYSMLSYLGRE